MLGPLVVEVEGCAVAGRPKSDWDAQFIIGHKQPRQECRPFTRCRKDRDPIEVHMSQA